MESNGWRLKDTKIKYHKLLSPNNIIFEIHYKKIKIFCEEHKLNKRCIYNIIFGKTKISNGWKYIETIKK